MAAQTIGSLFASDIRRRIEEVIKVDQVDEEILRDEIREYVTTDVDQKALSLHPRTLSRDPEQAARGHRHLGLRLLRLREVELRQAPRTRDRGSADPGPRAPATLFAEQVGDPRIEVLVKNIGEQIPTRAVIFDVSTDRGIRTGNQMLTEILYRQLLGRPRLRPRPRSRRARDHAGIGRAARSVQAKSTPSCSSATGTRKRERSPSRSARRAG